MGNNKRLAIVGFWEGNRNDAPFQDPTFDVWGLNHLWPYIPRWDVFFDMHSPEWSGKNLEPSVWKEQEQFFKTDHGKPLYMLQQYPDYPSSLKYPKEEIVTRFGRSYFTNGIAYMLAMALHVDRFEEIQLWGIDMRHNEEYALQRPCTEYWIGKAEGMGIKVYIPPSAALCSADADYGYDEQGGLISEAIRAHQQILAKAISGRDEALAKAQCYDGVIQDNKEWLRRWDQRSRGGIL